MPDIQPWCLSSKYKTDLSEFARRSKVKSPWIAPIIFSKEWAETAFPQQYQFFGPAFTWGGLVPLRFATLVGDSLTNRPIGIIAIRSDLQDSFEADERRFVLAHEYMHVLKNHWPLACLGSYAGDVVAKLIPLLRNQNQRDALGVMLPIARRFLSTQFTRQSEVEADLGAARLAGGKEVGLRTIRRLATQFCGGALLHPTHYVQSGDRLVGVLTFQDRLTSLSLSE